MRVYISRLALHNIFCDERYRYSLKETLSASPYQQLYAVSGVLTLGWLSCRDIEKSLNFQLFTNVWLEYFVNVFPIQKVLTFIYKCSCFLFKYTQEEAKFSQRISSTGTNWTDEVYRNAYSHNMNMWCGVKKPLIWHNEIVWPYVMMLTFKRKTVVPDNPNKFKPVPLVTRYCYSQGFGQMSEWVSAECHIDMKWNMLNLFWIPTLNLIVFIT